VPAAIKSTLGKQLPGSEVVAVPGEDKEGEKHTWALLNDRGEKFGTAGKGQFTYEGEVSVRGGYCHQDTATWYDLWGKDNNLGIATGYYANKSEGVWRSHSWLYDKANGHIVEVTPNKVSNYFGVKLTDKEATKFARMGGIL
jgi:hypothetical protein